MSTTATQEQNKIRVAVVGGGIGGLCVATGHAKVSSPLCAEL